MTERLYYHNSFLYDFTAKVLDTRELTRSGSQSIWAVKLDRTAFYPTSGGQPFDTGRLMTESKSGVQLEAIVDDVVEEDDGEIWHQVNKVLPPGAEVRGLVDIERRRDHMQQHTGQHLLSAAFIELLDANTVSFHLGDQISTIDLDKGALSHVDLVQVERLANQVISEDRPITVRYAARDQALQMGVRKLPERAGEIRLIAIENFDLNACGGTHARSTGQIGGLLLRRMEKSKLGVRVEFLCGIRAVAAARADFELLGEAAGLYPCAPGDLPANIAKQREEARQTQKYAARVLEELAELKASQMLRDVPADNAGRRLFALVLEDRDAAFIKLLAQRLTRESSGVVALLGSLHPAPALVFARSTDVNSDMGTLLRELVTAAGGRGGGAKDFAQGGVPTVPALKSVIDQAALRAVPE